jgi:hypothetical protein
MQRAAHLTGALGRLQSTLFNALCEGGKAEAANYPFCTIEANSGVVAVPDVRLQVHKRALHVHCCAVCFTSHACACSSAHCVTSCVPSMYARYQVGGVGQVLSGISKSKSVVPTSVEFVDIAGLVKGASKGEGLGNQFLANIRECDSIVQARPAHLRCACTMRAQHHCSSACLAHAYLTENLHCFSASAYRVRFGDLQGQRECAVRGLQSRGMHKCSLQLLLNSQPPLSPPAPAQVVRCFEDENVIHVAGRVDPLSDIDVINFELALADIGQIERRLERLAKGRAKSKEEVAAAEVRLLPTWLLAG